MKKISLILMGVTTFCTLNANELNLDGQTVQLQSLESGYCVQLESNNDKEGTKFIQAPCEKNNSTQKFTFTKSAEDYTVTLNNGKALSVAAQSESNGVNLVQNTTEALFKIASKNKGFTLQAKHSNKYVSTTAYNTDIVQAGKDNQANQLWTVYSDTKTYASCKEILASGESSGSGTYTIDINGNNKPFEVYCDMDTKGGGWTVYDFRKYTTYNDMANSTELANFSTNDPILGHTYNPETSFHQNSSYGLRWGHDTPTYDNYLEKIIFNTPNFNEIIFKGGLPAYQGDWGELNIYAYSNKAKGNWLNVRLRVDKNTCHQWSAGMYWTSSKNGTKNFELEEGLANGCRGIGIKEHYINTQINDLNTIRLGLGGHHLDKSRHTEAFIDYIKVR